MKIIELHKEVEYQVEIEYDEDERSAEGRRKRAANSASYQQAMEKARHQLASEITPYKNNRQLVQVLNYGENRREFGEKGYAVCGCHLLIREV